MAAQLPWLAYLASLVCDMDCGLVAKFRLCNLWSLVRSPMMEIMVYTTDETVKRRNSCPVFPYVVRRSSPDFLIMVIQFTVFLRIFICFCTTIWMHHMDANKTHREKAWWEIHKNATWCCELILEVTLHKTFSSMPTCLPFHKPFGLVGFYGI